MPDQTWGRKLEDTGRSSRGPCHRSWEALESACWEETVGGEDSALAVPFKKHPLFWTPAARVRCVGEAEKGLMGVRF